MTPSVLFVDDEKNIISAIRRALIKKSGEWNLLFADSGAQACEILHKEPIDIIVTDMRMPGMDGIQVLEEVKKHSPWAVRIILSGYSDKEALIRAARISHQYIAKPTSRKQLVAKLSKAIEAMELFPEREQRIAAASVQTLPVSQKMYNRFVQLVEQEDEYKKLPDIIHATAALTARVLQIANSAYFSQPGNVTSVHGAAQALGRELFLCLLEHNVPLASIQNNPGLVACCEKGYLLYQLVDQIAHINNLPAELIGPLNSAAALFSLKRLLPFLPQYANIENTTQDYFAKQAALILAYWGIPCEIMGYLCMKEACSVQCATRKNHSTNKLCRQILSFAESVVFDNTESWRNNPEYQGWEAYLTHDKTTQTQDSLC